MSYEVSGKSYWNNNKSKSTYKTRACAFVEYEQDKHALKNLVDLLSKVLPEKIEYYTEDKNDLLVFECGEEVKNSEYLKIKNVKWVSYENGNYDEVLTFFAVTQNDFNIMIAFLAEPDEPITVNWCIISKDENNLFNHFCRLCGLNIKELFDKKLQFSLKTKENAKTRHKI